MARAGLPACRQDQRQAALHLRPGPHLCPQALTRFLEHRRAAVRAAAHACCSTRLRDDWQLERSPPRAWPAKSSRAQGPLQCGPQRCSPRCGLCGRPTPWSAAYQWKRASWPTRSAAKGMIQCAQPRHRLPTVLHNAMPCCEMKNEAMQMAAACAASTIILQASARNRQDLRLAHLPSPPGFCTPRILGRGPLPPFSTLELHPPPVFACKRQPATASVQHPSHPTFRAPRSAP